jgi:hypothetical protein
VLKRHTHLLFSFGRAIKLADLKTNQIPRVVKPLATLDLLAHDLHPLQASQIPFPANSNQYRFNNEFLKQVVNPFPPFDGEL